METFKLYKRTERRESQQSSCVVFCFVFSLLSFFKNTEAVTTEVIGESQPLQVIPKQKIFQYIS